MANTESNIQDLGFLQEKQVILDQQNEITCLTLDKINMREKIDWLEYELYQSKLDLEHQTIFAISGLISTVTFGVLLLLEYNPTIGKLIYNLWDQIIGSIF